MGAIGTPVKVHTNVPEPVIAPEFPMPIKREVEVETREPVPVQVMR